MEEKRETRERERVGVEKKGGSKERSLLKQSYTQSIRRLLIHSVSLSVSLGALFK